MAVQIRHVWILRSVACGIIFDLILLSDLVVSSGAPGKGRLDFDDVLTPYKTGHGPLHRRHRDTQSCQSVRYGNVTHTKHPAHKNTLNLLPVVETHYMTKQVGSYGWDKKMVYINHQVVNNPLTTWSVLEPAHPGTCQNGTAERTTVEVSAQQKKCLAASNGGLFNTHTGQCLGNIVSDGILVQDSGGIQNVHFGLTRDGYIYTGYLSELDLLAQDFTQLVGGVVWLVRDGVNYVDQSKSIECPDTEETGTVERFVTVLSARSAVGHDAEGRIHMVQVNGKTDTSGMDLYKLSDLLIELGLVNAINLDGGGSTTTVINGTLANYPSDFCSNSSYNCARNVSTILCVHLPDCAPGNCSGHGTCDMGVCRCLGHWSGPSCDVLACPDDCSWNGQCTQDGCQCVPGWKGDNCSLACDNGWYGTNCSLPCMCGPGALCNSITGSCTCLAGYTGRYCLSACPVGYFGPNCREVCDCQDSCLCDPVTGNCNMTITDSDLLTVGQCLAKQEIKGKHLALDTRPQYDVCMASLLGIAVLVTASLTLNVLLIYFLVRASHNRQKIIDREVRLAVKHSVHKMMSVAADSENDDEDDTYFYCKKKKKTEDILCVVCDEEENIAGSGDDEEDLFLAPTRVNGRTK